ncbi:zinc finger protein 236-like [Anopheles albimanus]|nr:zinc finger protein 236-like [Anopheles albimanus]XP_035791592.1 zinc finger protein 236-like [Anopheles albimanus]XP_035791593.1 zinc finger protein 236-like [Anopheles albimanus]XP_035791594.1 zinc finger protein 236-like [Anopheles albimanus]
MQKKIVQQSPQVRKIFTTTTNQHQQQQANAVKKINSLLQSGTVSVISGQQQQQRMMAQKKPLSGAPSTSVSITSANSYVGRQQKCYICGDHVGSHGALISEASTTTTQTDFVAKLAKVIGAAYSVVLATDDVICRRCITILNQLDKLESEMESLRTTLLGFIHKKNNIPDDDLGGSGAGAPPAKMQKLMHTNTAGSGGILQTTTTPTGLQYTVKTVGHQQQQQHVLTSPGQVQVATVKVLGDASALSDAATDAVEAQLTSMFEKGGGGGGTLVVTTAQAQQQQTQQAILHQQPIVVSTNNGALTVNTHGASVTTATAASNVANRKSSKVYRCLSCEFKTHDLAEFQPHYEQCKLMSSQGTGTTAHRCKYCKKAFASLNGLRQHHLQEHPTLPLPTTYAAGVTQKTAAGAGTEGAGAAAGQQTGPSSLYSCTMCQYRTADKQQYDDHLRKHIKLKPFKCRVCLMRFETREQASVHAKQHQPDYFKCSACNITFQKRDELMKHLEQHESAASKKEVKPVVQQQQQQQQTQQQQQMKLELNDSSTQKLLQESIDEALRETMGETIDAKSIQFHTCSACSLTFLNEKLYTQHIKTHATGHVAASATTGAGTTLVPQTVAATTTAAHHQVQVFSTNSISSTVNANRRLVEGTATALAGKQVTQANATVAGGAASTTGNSISDGDLESIFERMHSEKGAVEGAEGSSTVLITNQDGTTEKITYNLASTQHQEQQAQDGSFGNQQLEVKMDQQPSVGIDMPTLDQGDEQKEQQQEQQQQQQQISIPVSMPSLDDDGDQSQNSQNSNTETVPMELDDMQAANAPYKIILNHEGGQFLHLDNHILTDGEGNQILVQGTDSEQIQQLLQSVGVVMQGGEGLGEGEIQMISCEGNNQMILVQGADGQEQLIHPSQLNADGNIVIQQSQEGELMTTADGATHITTEDGLQIPVSMAFTTTGEVDQEGHLTVSMAGADGAEGQQIQLHLQQATAEAGGSGGEGGDGEVAQQQEEVGTDEQQQQQQHHHAGGAAILTEGGQIILQKAPEEHHQSGEAHEEHQVDGSQVVEGEANGGSAEEEHSDQQHHEAHEAQNGASDGGVDGDVTASGTGSIATVTTTTTATSGTIAATTATTVTAAVGGGDDGGSAEDQMFNFDELIQPQIVIKQQQVHN